ncbi:MAG: hypothetical protein LBM39_00535 [Candidatus Methanoplasma sp.]|jgi:hypothetical protein|nr:hypothetical protein [Candidatus Methanoplasma sp.]
MVSPKHSTTVKACDVSGCENDSERSISLKLVAKSSLKLKDDNLRSVHLCKDHYKALKKETKTDRGLDKVYE